MGEARNVLGQLNAHQPIFPYGSAESFLKICLICDGTTTGINDLKFGRGTNNTIHYVTCQLKISKVRKLLKTRPKV